MDQRLSASAAEPPADPGPGAVPWHRPERFGSEIRRPEALKADGQALVVHHVNMAASPRPSSPPARPEPRRFMTQVALPLMPILCSMLPTATALRLPNVPQR